MPSTSGLILVIPDKPDIERDAVAAIWEGEVVRLGRFWEPPPLDPERVRVYGPEAFCQVLAQKLGLTLVSPPDDWLLHVPFELVKRTISRERRFPAFVKSFIPKLIESRVYDHVEWPDDVDVFYADPVEFLVEARTWILDGEVLGAACCEGDAPIDPSVALAAAAPSPCVIDIGLTRDRGWVIIEANAAWGAGLNGCDPRAAARCIARASTR